MAGNAFSVDLSIAALEPGPPNSMGAHLHGVLVDGHFFTSYFLCIGFPLPRCAGEAAFPVQIVPRLSGLQRNHVQLADSGTGHQQYANPLGRGQGEHCFELFIRTLPSSPRD